MGAVSIGEEIISLQGPGMVEAIFDIHVLGWGRVEGIDPAILIDIVDEFVHVLVPAVHSF